MPASDFTALDNRLAVVEREVAELREQLTEERIATGRLAAQVDAHEIRGQERHAQLLDTLQAIREDQRHAAQQAAAREARSAKVALGVISVLGTAVAGLAGMR